MGYIFGSNGVHPRAAISVPVVTPVAGTQRILVWRNGSYDLAITGATDQECVDKLNNILLGNCKHYAAEFKIVDAPSK